MITLVNDKDHLCGSNDVFAIKIRSSALAYGFDRPFLLTWVQTIEDKPVAFIQKQDGAVTLWADNADYQELKEFLDVMGYESVFMDKALAHKLYIPSHLVGKVMEHRGSAVAGSVKKVAAPDYKAIYALLCDCGFNMPPFEPFYLDLSHRVRHNTARVFANNDYSAVTFTAWETETDAVISAVAVRKDVRRTGIGSDILQSVISQLKEENKRVFLYCEAGENQEFYIKNGMLNCGEFAVFEREHT